MKRFEMIKVVLLMMCVGKKRVFLMEVKTLKLFREVVLGWINDRFENVFFMVVLNQNNQKKIDSNKKYQ